MCDEFVVENVSEEDESLVPKVEQVVEATGDHEVSVWIVS